MRWLLVNPVVVLLVAAVGVAVCHVADVNYHPASLAAAGAICLLTAEVAIGVAMSQRKAAVSAFAQTCLVSMGVHLLLSLLLCGGLYLTGQLPKPFVFWAIAMFWATLIAVSVVLAGMLRGIAAQAGVSGEVPPTAQ